MSTKKKIEKLKESVREKPQEIEELVENELAKELSDKQVEASRLYAGELLDDVFEEASLRGDVDFWCIVFSLYIHSIQILSTCGWSKKDLLEEVRYHYQRC